MEWRASGAVRLHEHGVKTTARFQPTTEQLFISLPLAWVDRAQAGLLVDGIEALAGTECKEILLLDLKTQSFFDAPLFHTPYCGVGKINCGDVKAFSCQGDDFVTVSAPRYQDGSRWPEFVIHPASQLRVWARHGPSRFAFCGTGFPSRFARRCRLWCDTRHCRRLNQIVEDRSFQLRDVGEAITLQIHDCRERRDSGFDKDNDILGAFLFGQQGLSTHVHFDASFVK